METAPADCQETLLDTNRHLSFYKRLSVAPNTIVWNELMQEGVTSKKCVKYLVRALEGPVPLYTVLSLVMVLMWAWEAASPTWTLVCFAGNLRLARTSAAVVSLSFFADKTMGSLGALSLLRGKEFRHVLELYIGQRVLPPCNPPLIGPGELVASIILGVTSLGVDQSWRTVTLFGITFLMFPCLNPIVPLLGAMDELSILMIDTMEKHIRHGQRPALKGLNMEASHWSSVAQHLCIMRDGFRGMYKEALDMYICYLLGMGAPACMLLFSSIGAMNSGNGAESVVMLVLSACAVRNVVGMLGRFAYLNDRCMSRKKGILGDIHNQIRVMDKMSDRDLCEYQTVMLDLTDCRVGPELGVAVDWTLLRSIVTSSAALFLAVLFRLQAVLGVSFAHIAALVTNETHTSNITNATNATS